ncbi:MAG: ERF family protein [Patescibacteria group bacterium]|nr:ERF family protein [Patescibacteria group bacterium]
MPTKKTTKAEVLKPVPVGSKALAVRQQTSPEVLIAQAIEKGTPVETMERLLAMRRELRAEQAKEAYDRAMSAFQTECPTIEKTKKVLNKDKSVRYSYAPIDKIVEQVRPLLQKHGFSYTIDAPVEHGFVTAICKVTHELGHSVTSSFKIPIDKDSYMTAPQKFASALTFGKRYAFCNAFGILTGDEDDDTEAMQEAEELAKKFDTLKRMISGWGKFELKQYREKMANSDKYTAKQKEEFMAIVDARMKELLSKEKPQ